MKLRDLGLEQLDAIFDGHLEDLLWHQVSEFEPSLVDRVEILLLFNL